MNETNPYFFSLRNIYAKGSFNKVFIIRKMYDKIFKLMRTRCIQPKPQGDE